MYRLEHLHCSIFVEHHADPHSGDRLESNKGRVFLVPGNGSEDFSYDFFIHQSTKLFAKRLNPLAADTHVAQR